MQRQHTLFILVLLIFLVSTALRFSLAMVNREANDDHLEVARMIQQERRLPGIEECLECFHPKLFHSLAALLFRGLGDERHNPTRQIVLAQLLNAFLGTILILIFWIFLKMSSIQSEALKLIAFALLAFNPSLIGINAQATNDTLAILFATLAIFFAWLYLAQERWSQLIASILFISLGVATKTNVFVTGFAILVALLIKAFTMRQTRLLYSAALFLPAILVLSFLNPLTQYRVNYQRFGSVVGMNLPKQPFPAFIENSYVARPGIISIYDGILTFKFGSLLQHPRLTNDPVGYPAHRTSLWTQVYARAHSVHFDNWPLSWSTEDSEGFPLTRAIYILALLPAAVLLTGAVVSTIEFLRALAQRSVPALSRVDYGLFDILFWGHILFLTVYALTFRDFSVMKAIFIYPALLAFLVLFLRGGSAIQRFFGEQRGFTVVLVSLTFVLISLYSLDIYTLSRQLYLLLA